MLRATAGLLLLLAFISAAGCGPTVDLTKGLQVDIVNAGWFDLGIVNGQTKLVPSVTFTLKNTSDQTLVALQTQALFRRVNAPRQDDHLVATQRVLAGNLGSHQTWTEQGNLHG